MLATVQDALLRFRRRLRQCVFAAAATHAATLLAAVACAVLLAWRLGDGTAPTWLSPSLAAGSVLAAAASFGWWRAVGTRVKDAQLVEHLEQRLGTDGLLLVAAEGVGMSEPFAAQLTLRLQHLAPVLPQLQLGRRLWRPTLSIALLVGATLLPAPVARLGGGPAATAAIERLAEQVERLVALPAVPEDVRRELQATVQDLQQRATEGQDGPASLWREIDQLNERLEREVAGLAADGLAEPASPAQGLANGEMASGSAADEDLAAARGAAAARHAQLAEAVAVLQQAGRWPEAVQRLPADLQQAVRRASNAAGQLDLTQLPVDSPDPALTPQALEQLAAALVPELQAARDDEALGGAMPELAESLQHLAEQLAGSPSASQSQAADPRPEGATPRLQQSIAEGLAELSQLADASQLSGMGKLSELLPDALQQSLGEGAAQLVEQALRSVDLSTLLQMLPDDPQQLQALAQQLGELLRQVSRAAPAASPAARESAGERVADAAAAASEAMRGMSREQQQRIQQLAERLAQASGQPAGGSAAGRGRDGASAGADSGSGSSSGRSGGSAANGNAASGSGPSGSGAAGRGPGHAALRMTEQATVGGARELALPPPIDPEQLPREWRPIASRKAEPEVAEPAIAGPGINDPGIGAPGAAAPHAAQSAPADAAGTATWQLRLMPRHRAAVRRFFGGGAPAPTSNGERGGDDK